MPIRTAYAHEAADLTALCLRSKAHWGYDAAFMARVGPHLAIPPDLLEAGRVFVSEDAAARPAATMALSCPDARRRAELVLLFTDPSAMGRGHGTMLLAHALAMARGEGASRLRVLSDPHAEAFYCARGARRIGSAASDAIPGRTLPRLEWRIG